MTTREMLSAIINGAICTAEMEETAKAEIEKMNGRNAKRSAKNAEKRAEVNTPIKEAILSALADGAKVASELAVACEVSTQKISPLAKQLVEEGKVSVSDHKVKGGRTVKQYALVK